MAEIEIYTSAQCPYCVRAKSLLAKKGLSFKEYNVSDEPKLREEMTTRTNGKKTVPQIFINGNSIGGSDDLAALERDGKLDALLSAAA